MKTSVYGTVTGKDLRIKDVVGPTLGAKANEILFDEFVLTEKYDHKPYDDGQIWVGPDGSLIHEHWLDLVSRPT